MNQLPEEQPRYVIDEDQKSESKILPEEQARALKKLVNNAGHFLDGEEREVLHKLLEKLDRETERIRSLKKMTVGEKPLDEYLSEHQQKKKENHKAANNDGEEESEAPPRERKSIQHVVGFKPEEVVKRYIECWNQQKFGAEYDCFNPDFINTDRESYVTARQKFYQQQMGQGGMRIDFDDIESCNVIGTEAEVVATKTIQQGNRKPQQERDLYRLKLINGRWLIDYVEQL